MNRRFPLSAIAIATALLSPISNADGNEIERIVVTADSKMSPLNS